MSNVETSDQREGMLLGAADEEFDKLSPDEALELFARTEAEGAGDYETSSLPSRPDGFAFVDSYDAAYPQWSRAFLEAVQRRITDLTAEKIAELSRGLTSTPDARRAKLEALKRSIDGRLDLPEESASAR